MPTEWPLRFCTKCGDNQPFNSHNRCLSCQRERSKAYAARKKASGGAFSKAIRAKLIAENPERCPKCSTLWAEVPRHSQHPDTPWHFDHHISPQNGGTNADENARILCWRCNLEKLNR